MYSSASSSHSVRPCNEAETGHFITIKAWVNNPVLVLFYLITPGGLNTSHSFLIFNVRLLFQTLNYCFVQSSSTTPSDLYLTEKQQILTSEKLQPEKVCLFDLQILGFYILKDLGLNSFSHF